MEYKRSSKDGPVERNTLVLVNNERKSPPMRLHADCVVGVFSVALTSTLVEESIVVITIVQTQRDAWTSTHLMRIWQEIGKQLCVLHCDDVVWRKKISVIGKTR